MFQPSFLFFGVRGLFPQVPGRRPGNRLIQYTIAGRRFPPQNGPAPLPGRHFRAGIKMYL
jgi:hypothetical protein